MISEKLRKWIYTIPINVLHELHSITQEIPFEYDTENKCNKWRYIDEVSQVISYAMREGNNPEYDVQKCLEFDIEKQIWMLNIAKLKEELVEK